MSSPQRPTRSRERFIIGDRRCREVAASFELAQEADAA
jgi:hypothetical protein